MKIKLLIAGAIVALSASCAGAQPKYEYTVKVNLSTDNDGELVYLTDLDTGEKIDSVLVEGGIAVFRGTTDAPKAARLLSNGNRLGSVYLEEATIDVWPAERRLESTGHIAAIEDAFHAEENKLGEQLMALPEEPASQAKADSIYAAYNDLVARYVAENADNPFGQQLFMSMAYDMELPQYDEYLAKYPALAQSARVQNLRTMLANRAETSEGKKYKDFAVTYNGTTKRLSDYVGPDHYTIVDFWASWCGPCIRQVKVLKELYDEYADKGLRFLSVAVWDEPENTLKAIESHQINWDQIIDAQSIPTELYGISGIPCIILIAPDGTIVSRGKQSDELKADVAKAMQGFAPESENE